MMNPLKIEVPNPCNQNWKEMLPTQHGKLCSNCATEVIDFTKFSNDQLRAWFDKANGERVCGNFGHFQLDIFNKEVITRNSWYAISAKIILASCLTLLINSKVNTGTKVQQNQIIIHKNNYSKALFKREKSKAIIDSLITIRGIVKAEDDNSPLPGVWIGTKDGKRNTVTDVNGKFSIQVASTKTVDLVFKSIGFDHLTKKVYVKKHSKVVIMMKLSAGVLGEVVIRKPSKFKRAWWSVKKVFKKNR